ncbi:MAG TPA: hypothetical protein VIY48_12085 [Candidatus Paceibacterota bacterium]
MKIDLELPDKPEVHAIAGMLNIDPNAVVGMLIRVWQWFDKHTTDGNAHGVTYSLPDRICGVNGFGEAMAFVGWLEQQDKTLVMPKFDRHTSASAKARALTAKRVSNHKANSNAQGNGDSVSDALPREEKRRDKEHTPAKADAFSFKSELLNLGASGSLVADWLAVRKAKKASNTKTALDAFLREVKKAGYTTDQALRICCEKSWQGFNAEWVKDIKTDPVSKAQTLSPEEYAAKRKADLKAAREAYMAQEAAATVPVVRSAQ